MKNFGKGEKKSCLYKAPSGKLHLHTRTVFNPRPKTKRSIMKAITLTAVAIVAVAVLFSQSAQAAARSWNNVGTDFNTTANWTGGVPGTGDVGLFDVAEVTQPNLSASLTIAGLRFTPSGATGYDITNTGGAVLTLNGVSTTGSGGTTTASASAFRNDNTTGTTQVDAPLNLAPSTLISTIFQEAGDGSTLILNGAIGQTGTVALSLKNGTIELNGNNSYSGGTSVDAAGTTVVVGNDNGLGSGTFSNNSTSTFQAGGGARTLANDVVLAGNMTVSGSNAVTFNGSVTSSGSNSRALTVSNTGGAILNGNVFLSESDTLARSLLINGSSAVTINGVVTNNNVGDTLASALKYSGTSTLTLNNTNTYSGGTSINVAGGTIVANKDGALGSGNITLTAAGVTLTLQTGVLNNYIADAASISIFAGALANLNFTGASDTVAGITLGGVVQTTPGTYGSTSSGADFQSDSFAGTGTLLLTIPEPSTAVLLGLGLLIGAQRLRRKNS
jgi:fibronectin-binding autotransporter adhesin